MCLQLQNSLQGNSTNDMPIDGCRRSEGLSTCMSSAVSPAVAAARKPLADSCSTAGAASPTSGYSSACCLNQGPRRWYSRRNRHCAGCGRTCSTPVAHVTAGPADSCRRHRQHPSQSMVNVTFLGTSLHMLQAESHVEAVQHRVLVVAQQVPVAPPHSIGHQAEVCTQALPRPSWPQPPTLAKQAVSP